MFAVAARPRLALPSLPLSRLIGVGLVLVSALGAAAAVLSYRNVMDVTSRTMQLREEIEKAQQLIILVAESEAAKRMWLLTGRPDERDAMLRAADTLRNTGPQLAGALAEPLNARGLPPVGELLEHVMRLRDQVQAANESTGLESAVTIAVNGGMARAKASLRRRLGDMAHAHRAEVGVLQERLVFGQLTGLATIGASSLAMLAMLLGALALLAKRRRTAEDAGAAMDRRGQEVATLFRMGELLQSSVSAEDIRRVVAHTAGDLMPDLGGAFYAFSNSRDRLDLLGVWGGGGDAPRMPEHFAPNECWALKRGRVHLGGAGALQCDHAVDTQGCTLCVPMQARGEVHGVLTFHAPSGQLNAQQIEMAQALADGVSLSLANLSLREKLRNQALRDELTGLYNRRFLEETLPRLVAHAQRRGAPIAVMMLDLDHFKQVNDRYGHAVGDAVLREVGGVLLSRLRQMDVACRYGGEELTVLLPDCTAEQALVRADEICGIVRGLSEGGKTGLPAVTISIGVAAWPEHGEEIGSVIEAADAALYHAKRQGRDRAVAAAATGRTLPLAA